MSDKQTGTVKWFNNAKGYGFISPEGGGKDLFVHMNEILMDGYKTLSENQNVEFEVTEGEKGLAATKVKPLYIIESNLTDFNLSENNTLERPKNPE